VLCVVGTQSPIDIIESSIEKVNDGFTETIGWVLPADSYANFIKGGNGFLMESNNGHAYQVDNIGAFLMWGPKGQQAKYNLVEFHFHTLSEHKVNGEHYDMEMQFVHVLDEATDASHWTWTPKKTLIAAQFFKAGVGMGTPNWLRELAKAAPSLTKDPAQTVPVDFAAISQSVLVGSLPQSGPPNDNFRPNFENYVKYDGSITTPPCTEGVQWVVFRNPIFAEKQDLNPFMALEGENYRPVQPLNGRKLVSNIDKWDNIDLSASGR
jgi:carbonic anhydrase